MVTAKGLPAHLPGMDFGQFKYQSWAISRHSPSIRLITLHIRLNTPPTPPPPTPDQSKLGAKASVGASALQKGARENFYCGT